MEGQNLISSKIVRLLEGVRVAEGMSFQDFVTHFDITYMSYYRWNCAVRDNKTINIPLSTLQKGLDSLGYSAYVIITKAETK